MSRCFAEADLMVYANVNYVAMDAGYKSSPPGCRLQPGDQNPAAAAETLRKTNSLFDPPRSASAAAPSTESGR